MMSRRHCLQSLGALTTMDCVKPGLAAPTTPLDRQIYIFTKPIQELSYADAAKHLAQWDVGGVEATIRKDGWIEPSVAPVELPKLVEALDRVDRRGMIITSDINDATHPDVERVLKTGAKLGVRYFRMAYYRYDLNKKILPQLESFARQAQALANVCRDLKMTALYQNHAGRNLVGAPMWDLMELLQGIDPSAMSIALDIRHATVEATESWPSAYARVKDSIGAMFVKDAPIVDGKPDDGPLGRSAKGKELFHLIRGDHPNIPMSLHMEYLDHRKADLLPQRLEAIGRDVATLKNWLRG